MSARSDLLATAAQHGYDLRQNHKFDAGWMSDHDMRVLALSIEDDAALDAKRAAASAPLATDAQVSEFMDLNSTQFLKGINNPVTYDEAVLMTRPELQGHIDAASTSLRALGWKPAAEVQAEQRAAAREAGRVRREQRAAEAAARDNQ